MKSLRNVQILMKVLQVLCLIFFIIFIIGAVGSAVGLICLPFMKDMVIDNGKTFEQVLVDNKLTMADAYAGCAIGVISCGVGAFLAKYTEILFKDELVIGTPFNHPFVKKMRKVALVNIIGSLASVFVCAVTVSIIYAVNGVGISFKWELASSVGFGISLLLLSLFCEYGADLNESKKGPTEPEANEENRID